MGTNYYAKHMVTEEDIEKMRKLLPNQEELMRFMKTVLIPEVHICKISYGWKTCFDHNNGEYYQPNYESLANFLKDHTIIDEYGAVYSFKEFWKLVRDHDAHNKRTSDETFLSYWQDHINTCTQLFGVRPTSTDFEVDGLRFAIYTDFS